MQHEVKLLDHGYLRFVEHWGSDERITEAARMSTGKGFLGWEPGPCLTCKGTSEVWDGVVRPASDASTYCYKQCPDCEGKGTVRGDKFLLKYLYENKHSTPFEMAGLVIEVQAPIMVFREWHRHRTQSYNEMSARYVPLPDVNYVPTVERLMLNSKTNRRAGVVKGAADLTEEAAQAFQNDLRTIYKQQQTLYEVALASGVPKELARIHLPVGRYSRMRASANLHNWLAFLTLRMDEKAQYEIRMYANALGDLIATLFPRTWALFVEGRK